MGCNCGKNKGKGYVVNYPDGTKTKVSSLSQACRWRDASAATTHARPDRGQVRQEHAPRLDRDHP